MNRMCWVRLAFEILLGPGLLLVALLPWHLWSVARGLRTRSRRAWRLSLTEDQLQVWVGERLRHQWRLGAIARARYAQNANWTESTIVEDALTLYDAHGSSPMKIPASAEGFRTLLGALQRHEIPITTVQVDAPAFLD